MENYSFSHSLGSPGSIKYFSVHGHDQEYHMVVQLLFLPDLLQSLKQGKPFLWKPFLHVCNWHVQQYQRISVFTWFSVQNPYSERLLKELSTKSSPCSFNLTVNFTFSTHTKFYNEYYIPHFAASFPLFYCKHLNSRHWCVLLFRLTTYLADSSSVVKFQLFIPTSLW